MVHNQLFKRLLRTFFADFLRAFVPELHAQLQPRPVEFLDKELLGPASLRRQSHRRIVDLVAKVRLRGQAGFILVHTEHQAQPQNDLVWRMLAYAVWLREQYGLPVYPILVCSYERPFKAQPDCFRMEVAGVDVLQFRFRVVQLNRLDRRAFVRAPNPAATALVARMRIKTEDRVQVKVRILRLLTQLRLDRNRLELVAGFADHYLVLGSKEKLASREEVAKIEDGQQRRKVMKLTTQWERDGLKRGRKEGRAEGRIEGEQAVVLRLLRQRFGQMPNGLARQIRQLSLAQVETLAEALLDFATVSDLKRWLEEAENDR